MKLAKKFNFLILFFVSVLMYGVFGLNTPVFSSSFYSVGPPDAGIYCVCSNLATLTKEQVVEGSKGYSPQQCADFAKIGSFSKIHPNGSCNIRYCEASSTNNYFYSVAQSCSPKIVELENEFSIYNNASPLLLGENSPKKTLELSVVADKGECGDLSFSCDGCVTDVIKYQVKKTIDGSYAGKGVTYTTSQAAKIVLDIDVTGEKIFKPTTNNLVGNVKIIASNACYPTAYELVYKIEKPDCTLYNDKGELECGKHTVCMWSNALKCVSKVDGAVCSKLSEAECGISKACGWIKENNQCTTVQDKAITDKNIADYPVPDGYLGPIPTCAFSGTCRDVNDLIQLFVNYGNMTIGIIAGFAFAFFVYGGFTMIMSFGNSEKVQKGQQILVAAVIGLIIVFSAYILIKFLLTALGVQQGFIGIT